jgi:hypothetical protein
MPAGTGDGAPKCAAKAGGVAMAWDLRIACYGGAMTDSRDIAAHAHSDSLTSGSCVAGRDAKSATRVGFVGDVAVVD